MFQWSVCARVHARDQPRETPGSPDKTGGRGGGQ